MNKKRILTLASVGGLGLALYAYGRNKTGKSLSSALVQGFLNRMNMQEKSKSLVTENVDQNLEKLKEKNAQIVTNPFSTFFNNHQEYLHEGMQVMDWNANGKDDQRIIFYYHGGGYAFQPWATQFLAVDSIARQTDARVIMPIYPKAPEFTFKDAFPPLGHLYKSVLNDVDESAQINIIGDSAGGGLALGFTYYLIDEDLPQPDHLVLICPWLDLKNSHPDLEDAMQREAFFGMEAIEVAAQLWAGSEENRKHPYASPKYGNLEEVSSHITLFTGTDEALMVDILDMIEKLKALGVDFDYEVKDHQTHVYPFYPTPEGAAARSKICQILLADDD